MVESSSDSESNETINDQMKTICHICGRELSSAINLSQHVATHQTARIIRSESGQISFRCDLCGKVDRNEADMQKHIALHDNKLKCVICGKLVTTKRSLVAHTRIHVRNPPIIAQLNFLSILNVQYPIYSSIRGK